MGKLLTVGLDSWIIQDGNYGDLEVEHSYKFALEFYPYKVKKIDALPLSFILIRNAVYRLNARIGFASKECCVIDFGFLAYDEAEEKFNVKEGEFYEMEVYLGIDPFFYFEGLYKIRNILPLIYEWKIKKIYLETTPWMESKDENGRKMMTRVTTRISHKAIQRTDAWKDDNGNASYLLEIENLEMRPSLRK